MVPPVPTPTTKWVILPAVCSHISGPVLLKCALQLLGLSYWFTYQELGVSFPYLLDTE